MPSVAFLQRYFKWYIDSYTEDPEGHESTLVKLETAGGHERVTGAGDGHRAAGAGGQPERARRARASAASVGAHPASEMPQMHLPSCSNRKTP